MALGSAPLISEVNDLLRGALVIPSIQRGYVWQKSKVPFLLDSLYRGYPVGSLLIWKTTLDVPLRMASVLQGEQNQLHPAVLLDGQQRITSLAKVIEPGKVLGAALDVRFDLDEQTFLNPSGPQRNNPRLLKVSELLGERPQFVPILKTAGTPADSPDFEEMYRRVSRVHDIRQMEIPVVTVESDDYEEVAEIFARVNQGGKRLSKGDLVYSAMAARWPEAPEQIQRFSEELDRQNFALDRESIFRLAGIVAGTGAHAIKLIGKEMTGDKLRDVWGSTEKAVRLAVDFLKGECGIPRASVLTSPNVVVVPAIALLARNGNLTPDESQSLRRWVYTSMAFSHYSSQVESKLDAEVRLIREAKPGLWDELLRRASGTRSVGAPIEPADLASRGQASPFFNLLYIAALRSGAKDWMSNQQLVDVPMTSTTKIEYHHIFPKARVEKRYGREVTNSLANLAFISGASNRKISAKAPEEYLATVPAERLAEQGVPTDPTLWSLDVFPQFLAERQLSLIGILNTMLNLRAYVPSETVSADNELPEDEDELDAGPDFTPAEDNDYE